MLLCVYLSPDESTLFTLRSEMMYTHLWEHISGSGQEGTGCCLGNNTKKDEATSSRKLETFLKRKL